MIVISESGEPINETELNKTETELGLKFPKSYRQFLLKNNGGRPSLNVFPIYGDSADTHGLINWFLCIDAKDDNDIVRSMALHAGRYPKNFLQIAEDPGGNAICLSVGGNEYGKVYFWDHENEVAEGEEPGYQNVYLIANSFDEFLNSLQEESVLDSISK